MTARAADEPKRLRRPSLGVVAIVYVVAVLLATLAPLPWAQSALADNSWGILNPSAWTAGETWVSGRYIEIIFNIALFVPIGYFAATLGRSRVVLLAPFALTTAIELAQLVLPDRASDPRDLVANSVGAVIGMVIAARRGRADRMDA
ncbi:MAG: VanZ family protein [Microbacteriaceae bacterium]|nr:VanZ family protein [Microbacteriaceae bacterium]